MRKHLLYSACASRHSWLLHWRTSKVVKINLRPLLCINTLQQPLDVNFKECTREVHSSHLGRNVLCFHWGGCCVWLVLLCKWQDGTSNEVMFPSFHILLNPLIVLLFGTIYRVFFYLFPELDSLLRAGTTLIIASRDACICARWKNETGAGRHERKMGNTLIKQCYFLKVYLHANDFVVTVFHAWLCKTNGSHVRL